jgi:hypothetical protein
MEALGAFVPDFDQISPVALTLERPTKLERFSRSEVEQISAIMPHL